jgi:FkbM family methyltransferase
LCGFDVHRLAVCGHEGEIKLGSGWLGASTTRANPNAGGGIGAWDEAHTCTVPCTTLRNFCKDLLDPLFIKIDVEGSEETIFKDLKWFAERKPMVLVELHPFWWKDVNQTWQDFEALKLLYKKQYEVHHKNSNTWVLID